MELRRGDGHLFEALGVGDDLGGVEGVAHGVDLRAFGLLAARGRRARSFRAISARRSRWADRARAYTASVMAVSGTPRSRADCAVQRPVPFCSASSRIASTSGLPVASVFLMTAAVISIR